MGIGDSILSTGVAKRIHKETGQKVRFGNGKETYYDDEIFTGNPKISRTEGIWVADYPGVRPYILGMKGARIIYNDDYRATPGELFGVERTAGDYILVETNTKLDYPAGKNKAWPYWDELLKADLPWRVNDKQPTFRDALRVLAGCKLYVGTDGALHHAAAALGIPSVVIWTGYSSPRHLGYASQVNIHDGSEPCGTFHKECPHCRKKAEAISPEQVLSAVERLFSCS